MKGKRIRYFRCRKGITQKELGKLIGFPDDAADIRMTQYENERRNPKIERTNKIAEALGVSPYALMVPGIDTPIELIHTLFAIEDIYGLVVNEMSSNVELNGARCLSATVIRGNDLSPSLRYPFVYFAPSIGLKSRPIKATKSVGGASTVSCAKATTERWWQDGC